MQHRIYSLTYITLGKTAELSCSQKWYTRLTTPLPFFTCFFGEYNHSYGFSSLSFHSELNIYCSFLIFNHTSLSFMTLIILDIFLPFRVVTFIALLSLSSSTSRRLLKFIPFSLAFPLLENSPIASYHWFILQRLECLLYCMGCPRHWVHMCDSGNVLVLKELRTDLEKRGKKKIYWAIARTVSPAEEIRGYLSHNWVGDNWSLNTYIHTHIIWNIWYMNI